MKTILIFILIVTSSRIYSQIRLVNEKIEKSVYKLSFSVDPVNYTISRTNSGSQILFEEYTDESRPGSFQIPRSELFIALPLNSNPEIKFVVVEKSLVDAVPVLNPEISVDRNGKISAKSEKLWNRSQDTGFQNHGIVKIGNNLCVHLTIPLFQYDPYTNELFSNKKFVVEILNDSPGSFNPTAKNEGGKVEEIIINKKFAFKNQNAESIVIKDDTGDWIDYQSEYVKMGLASDGIYRIKYADLEKTGVNINSVEPNTFQLFWKGKEVPIYVSGEEDGKFDPADYIEFVGYRNYGGKHREINAYSTPYNEYLDRYSDTTIVWLTWGKQKGIRVTSHNIPSGSAGTTINYYTHLVHAEQNIWFDFSTDQLVRRQMPDWLENETWEWRTQSPGTLDLNFTISDLVPDKPARAFVKLQSYAANVTNNAHKIGLRINNDSKVYDSLYFNSFQRRLINANFNSGLLFNGNNSIRCVSFPTKASPNSVYHDWYEIEYPRRLILSSDSLQFRFNDYTAEKTVNFEISGYSGSNLSIYRSAGMTDVMKITNYQKQSGKIIFTDRLDSTKRYFAVQDAKCISPRIYPKKKFINLRNTANTAEYIIITNRILSTTALEYSQFITESYRKPARVVYTDDIYDEFNYGFFSPEPIKEFLMSSYNSWSGAKPEYVLLLGSANYDYYENRQKQLPAPSHPDLVPSFGVPVSDNWFVNWDTHSMFNPRLKIGRIPARTEDDVRSYLSKHRKYITQPMTDVNKRFLFFSGGLGNNQQELDQLKNVNQFTIDAYVSPAPIGGISKHFFKTLVPNTNFGPFSTAAVQDAIDKSGIFISYLGHSGTQTWDNSITDAKQLHNNVNAFPLITDFGCSTAKFAEPDVTSFSELFVVGGEGQAISYIGNSSLGFTSTSLVAPKLFYETVLKDSVLTISEALNKTKTKLLSQYGASDVNKLFSLTNSLIGDPIISLRIPDKPNLNIKTDALSISQNHITTEEDSLRIVINYWNLGRVFKQKFVLKIRDNYNNRIIFERLIERTLPLFTDSVIVQIPVKNKPGNHKISVELDSENIISELREDDNQAEYNLFVASASFRSMTLSDYSNSLDEIKFLNPLTRISSTSIDYQVASDINFTNPVSGRIQHEELFTKIYFKSLTQNKRYWLRIKTPDRSEYEIPKSFVNSTRKGYLMNDSLSFSTGTMSKTVGGSTVRLGKESVRIEAISAGFNDGNTGVITKNNQNFIPLAGRGHNICVFDGSTYELKTFGQFDLLFGGTAAQDSYEKLLDSLKTSDIFVVVSVDEGSINLTSALKQKIRGFGSRYVDSLGFRDSWAMIGRKGAATGTVPESFSRIFKGRAIASTSFEKISGEGSFSTPFIGPVEKWKYLDVAIQKPEDSRIDYILYGLNGTGKIDTLKRSELSDNRLDLTSPELEKYPFMKIEINLSASSSGISPELSSIFAAYTGVPELATNYQVVSVAKDTLEQGESADLSFRVYNAGDSRAENFKVNVELIRHDNSREKIFDQVVDSIGVEKHKQFNLLYNTANVTGPLQFIINIDSAEKIRELYKDNNFYSVPFYVRQNTKPASLNLTFDGNDIINGDFVSPNPNIRVELNDQSLVPIRDTSAVKLFLNSKQVYFANNPAVKYAYSDSNPKFVVDYSPALENGSYTLKVLAKNATGQLIDSAGVVRNFSVKKELQLLNVYNYPNPMNSGTDFTFKLTQIPDELKIKIFTLAGRMIKEFSVTSSELRYDFNKIYWDGRDSDGDLVANGVYLYKVILRRGSEVSQAIQKLAVVR